jgi:hypothetical protein
MSRMDNPFSNKLVRSTPLHNAKSTPIALVRRTEPPRNYANPHQIVQLIIDKYSMKKSFSLLYQITKKNFNLILILILTKLKV